MITKAVIKNIPSENSGIYRVYIPYYRKANDSESDATYDATRCIIDGFYDDLNVGDVVYVGFEDNQFDHPIILGKLFTNGNTKVTTRLNVNSLKVNEKTSLSDDVSVGKSDLSRLITKINNILDHTASNK